MIRRILILLMCFCASTIQAQRHIIYSPDIASVKVVAGLRWQELPIIRLGGPEVIHISFDELSHQYHRYTYSIVHLDADWTESQGLFESDYIKGFGSGSQAIEDVEESINTTQNYSHYKLQIPNEDCQLTMSGNYRVDIRDDNADSLVMSLFFMVNEEKVSPTLTYSPHTDIDIRRNHQQVTLTVDYSRLGATDPRRQIKGYVLQNMRWDNAVTLPEAPIINQSMLKWEHCRPLIFEAGNEYHKFEILDIHRNSLNVNKNAWDGEIWHTMLWPDTPRPNYVYDEAAKGSFYIRNTDNSENDITSEYVMVHFYLKAPKPFPHPVYVNGQWTNDLFMPQYEMEWDEENKQYEVIVPLKYGYYSYQYLMLTPDGYTMIPPTEGSFYETQNVYNALIYYRSNIDRADRLVGVSR